MQDDPVSSPAFSSSNDNPTNGNRSPRTSCGGRGSQHRLRFIAAMAAMLAVFATGFGVGWYAKGRQCMTSCNFSTSNEEDDATIAPMAVSPTREPSNQFHTNVEDDDVSSDKDETEGSINMMEWSNTSKMCADNENVRDQLSAAARIFAVQFIDFIAMHFRYGNASAFDEDWYRAVPGFTATTRTAANHLSWLQGREASWVDEWRQKRELPRTTLPNRITKAKNTRNSGSNSKSGDTGGLHEFQVPSAVVSNGEVVFILRDSSEIVAIQATTLAIISRTNVPRLDPSSYIEGMILINHNRLVVFVQESMTYSVGSSYENNVTVAVYDTNDMSLLIRENLPGDYVRAHAVGPNVHIATNLELDIDALSYYLLPSRIQSLPELGHDLDEDSYRALAHEQLELNLEPFISHILAGLECAGLLQLPATMRFFNATSTMMSTESSMATITSFDATLTLRVKNTTSLLLPNWSWDILSSSDLLVISCWMSGTDSTIPYDSEDAGPLPLLFLIPFWVTGASVFLASPGIVRADVMGAPYAMDHVRWESKDYIRVLSAHFDDTDFGSVGPINVTIFEMSENSASVMHLAGHLRGVGRAGAIITDAAGLEGDAAFVITAANDTCYFSHVNMSNPTKPETKEELEIPGCPQNIQYIGPHSVLLVGGQNRYTNLEQLHIYLLAISELGEVRIEQQWKEEPLLEDSTNSRAVSSGVSCCGDGFLYDENSNTVIVPVYTNLASPCASVDDVTFLPDNVTCFTGDTETFDGFWVFTLNTTNGSIALHFVVDHRCRDGCESEPSIYPGSQNPQILIFNGDVMTIKNDIVFSHDLLTKKATPAPALRLNADCPNIVP